jgi:hypothetical protein
MARTLQLTHKHSRQGAQIDMNAEPRIIKSIEVLDDLIELAKRDLAECQDYLAKIAKSDESVPEPQQFTRQKFHAMT